jgi:hypothetical protein
MHESSSHLPPVCLPLWCPLTEPAKAGAIWQVGCQWLLGLEAAPPSLISVRFGEWSLVYLDARRGNNLRVAVSMVYLRFAMGVQVAHMDRRPRCSDLKETGMVRKVAYADKLGALPASLKQLTLPPCVILQLLHAPATASALHSALSEHGTLPPAIKRMVVRHLHQCSGQSYPAVLSRSPPTFSCIVAPRMRACSGSLQAQRFYPHVKSHRPPVLALLQSASGRPLIQRCSLYLRLPVFLYRLLTLTRFPAAFTRLQQHPPVPALLPLPKPGRPAILRHPNQCSSRPYPVGARPPVHLQLLQVVAAEAILCTSEGGVGDRGRGSGTPAAAKRPVLCQSHGWTKGRETDLMCCLLLIEQARDMGAVFRDVDNRSLRLEIIQIDSLGAGNEMGRKTLLWRRQIL